MMNEEKVELCFLIDRGDKPIISVTSEQGAETSCLIDTGANIPVWFVGKEYLLYRYSQAYPMEKKTILNGLGERPIYDVPVWIIPKFNLNDYEGNTVTYQNLLIAVLDASRFSFDMIIPLTMLNRTDFSFSYTESAVYGIFRITAGKKRLFVEPVFAKQSSDYLNKIQVFTDEVILS